MADVAKERQAVVVGGVRTPFVKAFAELAALDTIALGAAAVRGLLERFPVPREALGAIYWGGVILPGMAPNVGREIALDLKLPPTMDAMTVTRACTSGLRAITLGAAAIERGEVDVVIAGGSDSTSNAEVKLPQKLVHALQPLTTGKATPGDVLGLVRKLLPLSDILPRMPRIAERSTGKLMGESAEEMARRNEISREAQDAFAVTSHHRAAAAIASGRLAREIVPVDAGANGENGAAGGPGAGGGPAGGGRDRWVYADTLVRADTSADKLAKLKPVFAKDGTLTAGNSSPLTDGAAAVLLMSRAKAEALGMTPLARFASFADVGVDPTDQLLIGPAMAMPMALDRAGLALSDMDLVDMHEAFAAQVLSVVKALGSEAFGTMRLHRTGAVGTIDPDKLNVHGGSLAFGHPFGATGARMVTTMANELHETGRQYALLGICAAGGLGSAAVLENAAA